MKNIYKKLFRSNKNLYNTQFHLLQSICGRGTFNLQL